MEEAGIPVQEGNLGKSMGMRKFRLNVEDGEESSWTELQFVGCTKKTEKKVRQMELWLYMQALELGCLHGESCFPFTGCVTMAKLLNLSVPQLSHL